MHDKLKNCDGYVLHIYMYTLSSLEDSPETFTPFYDQFIPKRRAVL